MSANSSQLSEFRKALESNTARYGVEITTEAIKLLSAYYELLNIWNPRLHLVAPCSPREFARRHVLESLLLLPHLPRGAKVADIGSGAGLPIIPCLVARRDLKATLIEASSRKAVFLREAVQRIGLGESASVVAERFENVTAPQVEFVTCRALERFEKSFPSLVEWAPRPSTLLFLGGEGLRRSITQARLSYSDVHIPDSVRRYLFIVARD